MARPLPDGEPDLDGVAAAPQGQEDARADAFRSERGEQRMESVYRMPVPGGKHVALADAGGDSRAGGIGAHHHEPCACLLHPDRPEAEAEIAARDAAMRFQLRCHPLDGRRGNDEDTAAWAEHRHAKCPAAGVDGDAALAVTGERKPQLDAGLDLAAAYRAPAGSD